MTRLLTLAFLFLSIIKILCEQQCNTDLINNVEFNCEFSISGAVESLQCKSGSLRKSRTFSTLQINRTANYNVVHNSDDIFTYFLNSDLEKNSSFYSCKIHPVSAFIDSVENICTRQDYCIPQATVFINTSNIKSFKATKASILLGDFQNLTSLVSIAIIDTIQLNFSKVVFNALETLRTLTLKNDSLQDLRDGLFTGYQNLESIDLSFNRLNFFPKHAFGTLLNLKYLNLSYNLIFSISNNTFENIPKLSELYLSNNKLIKIDSNVFVFNVLLTTLDISYNNLTSLPSKVFDNLVILKKIFIRANNIETVPTDIFRNQPFLEKIDLSRNKINYISAFRNKSRLFVVNLSQNKLSFIDENLFLEAPFTFFINFSRNEINAITDNHVKPLHNVGVLDLSNNKISIVELGLTTLIKIRNLMLSNNEIKKFQGNWRSFVFLERLEVNNNEVEYLDLPPCIQNAKQTITFNFRYNKITRLGLQALFDDEKRAVTDRTMAGCLFNGLPKNFIDLTHNPLICDCNLYEFHSYLTRKRRIKLDSFLNLDDLICDSPSSLRNEQIFNLPDDVFGCQDAKNCPAQCICGIRGQDSKTFVNCTGAGLDEVPHIIPPNTSVLYFNRNHLLNLLSLNSKAWENLTELHANDNGISTLQGWDIPQNLQYLSLQGNKLKYLSADLMNFIANKSDFQLFLSNNDTRCDCKSKDLKNFLIKNLSVVKDAAGITCEIDNNGTKSLLPLFKMPDSILCPKVQNYNPKVIIVSLSLFSFFLITTLLIYYKQRQLILSCLFLHCGELFRILCEESESDEEKVFDAFIAYSSCDREIVMCILQELEEKEPNFKLCIHERDWLPGRYISDNIIHSVQSSKRTIIVLSDSFISSPWFRLELRAAVFKVSKDKMNKIIVILADSSTSLGAIDTELRHVITKRTYLVWGERWFWEKLRYVMPHKSCGPTPSVLSARNNYNNVRNSEMALIINDDCYSS